MNTEKHTVTLPIEDCNSLKSKKRPNQFTYKDIYERFHSKYSINKETECWEWNERLNKDGYGWFSNKDGRLLGAHKMSYVLFVSEETNGLYVCHKCDNRKCVNPEHLFLGTQKQNMDDMYNKCKRIRAKHGTTGMYGRQKCRCVICKAHNTKMSKIYFWKKNIAKGIMPPPPIVE